MKQKRQPAIEISAVYVAAPFNRKEEARVARAILEANGFLVSSRWIDYHLDAETMDEAVMRKEAQADVFDVGNADIFVLLNEEGWQKEGQSGGRFLEMGVALALGKRVIVAGAKTSIFHYLPQVEFVKDVAEVV